MIQAYYIHPSRDEAKSVCALKHTRGTAAGAEGVARCVSSSLGSSFSHKRAITTCPPALKFNAFIFRRGRSPKSINGGCHHGQHAMLNGKLAPSRERRTWFFPPSSYWFSGRCKQVRCGGDRGVVVQYVHSVSGRLHFGQVLCAEHRRFQLRLG